jgi:hypothetical protein
VIAVGDEVIDAVPGWLERAVISRLGTGDKPFLIANILIVSAALGAALGILAARRFILGAVGIALMAGVGTAASLADPQTEGAAPVAVGAVSAVAGIATLWLLLRVAAIPRRSATAATEPPVTNPPAANALDRRRFLVFTGAAVLVAGLGAFGGC